MLMALLPLTGWAGDLREATVVVKDIAYGATDQPVIQEVKIGNTVLSETTDYAVESWKDADDNEYYIYYTDAACANPVKNGDVYLKYNQLPVSTNPYYIKIISAPAAISGQNPPHSNSTSGLFYVTKKRIELTVTLGDMPAQYYTGQTYTEIDVPAGTTYVNVTPLVGGDNIQDVVNGTLKMSYAATLANVNSDGTTTVGSRTAAPITYSGLTADNYEFYYTAATIDVRQVKIIDGNNKLVPAISITSTGNTVGYNAKEQKPVFTVTFNGKALTADEFAANFEAVSTTSASINANTTPYTFEVRAKSESNFEGKYGGLESEKDLDTYKLTINKAGLRISVNNKTLVYDGKTLDFNNADAKFVDANVTENWTVAGLQGDDQLEKVASITGAFETGEKPTVGVKAYKLTATKYTGGDSKYDNYVINLVNGTLNITPRPITVYVTAASKKYLTADADATDYNATYPTTFTTLKGAINAKGYKGFSVYYGDENAQTVGLKDAFVNATDAQLFYGEYKTGTGASDTQKASVGYYVVRANAGVNSKGEYPEVLTIKAANTTNETNFKKNYDITIVKGKYTIKGGTVFVSADAKTKVYGDEDPKLTYIVEGIDPNDNNGELVTAPTLVRVGKGTVEGEKASTTGYDIIISGAVAPEGYDEIIYTSNKLYITKAPLTVTLPIQKLAKTVTTAAGAVDAFDKESIDIQGLKKGENPTATYDLSVNITNGQYETDVTVVDGYTLRLKTAFADNYEIAQGTAPETYKDFITGKVIIGDGTTADLSFESVDADKTEIEDHAEENATVKINFAPRNARTLGVERAWKAGEWTTMVLPFDISVADLSKTLGYAIVNVIDPTKTVVDGTSSKFYGKLTMKGGNGSDEVLVANKPFLIKLADDIKIKDGDDPYYYTFNDRKIVASDDLSVDAGKGAKFVGTYTTKTVTKDDNAAIWFMLGYRQPSENSWVYINGNSEATWDIVPFEGYIDMTAIPAAARNIIFYVEDVDGTVTAINGIKAEGAAKVAEGWYTLNGVKLQSAPTEKGIYINNGKKVVIK